MSKYTRLNKINHYHDSGSSITRKSHKNPCSSTMALAEISHFLPRTHDEPASRIAKQIFSLQYSLASPRNHLALEAMQQQEQVLNPKLKRNNTGAKMDHYHHHHSKEKYQHYHCYQHRHHHHKPINSRLAFLAFISLSLVALMCMNGVQSLNCYHCSSVDNPECDEAFTGRANITETDCVKHIGQPAKVCRKIVQYIEHKKVVIRSCGFIDEHEEKDKKPICYKRSGTFAIMMESCNCYTDNCNYSASLVPNQSVLSLLVAACSLTFYVIHRQQQNQQLLSQCSSRKR